MTLTKDSHEVFMTYAADASNWGGRPLVAKGNIDCTNEMRGNLSDLKQKGLCCFDYDYASRDNAMVFTAEGEAYAAAHGVELY